MVRAEAFCKAHERELNSRGYSLDEGEGETEGGGKEGGLELGDGEEN